MPVRLTRRGTRGAGFPRLPPWALAVFQFVNVTLFRLLGSRMRVQGRPLLLLTTTGAKTGRERRSTLGWFEDEPSSPDRWLIVASAAGAAAHPSWYVNLARRPEAVIEIAGQRIAVSADSLHGPERDRAWQRIVSLAPGYGAYTTKTDREIPVVRLTRRR
jgi:deazaflavin-dependent oxidoreductase (nitroreductase family)